jgi:hypothetical protein
MLASSAIPRHPLQVEQGNHQPDYNVGIVSTSLAHQDVVSQAGRDRQIARQGSFTWANDR